IDDVGVAHSHATATGQRANLVLVFGTMNINEATTRVGIVLVQAVEPKYARHYEILRRRQRIVGPKRDPASKNRIARHARADFFCDTEPPDRCFQAAFLCSDSEE